MTSPDKDSKSSEPELKKQRSDVSQQTEDEKDSKSPYVPSAIAQAIAIKATTLPDLNIPDERRTSSDEEDIAAEPPTPLSDSELPEQFRNPKKKKSNKGKKKKN